MIADQSNLPETEWKLVPKESTFEIIKAMWAANEDGRVLMERTYSAAIAAAPTTKDARLIAAAPDLLAALQLVRAHVSPALQPNIYAAIDAAIAKAIEALEPLANIPLWRDTYPDAKHNEAFSSGRISCEMVESARTTIAALKAAQKDDGTRENMRDQKVDHDQRLPFFPR